MRLKLFSTALLFAVGLMAFPGEAFGDDDLTAQIREEIKAYEKEKKKEDGKKFKAYWSDGLRFKSNNGKISLKIGGRIMFDNWWLDDDNLDSAFNPNSPIGNSPSGVEFRRVRFYNQGKIGKHFEYKLQLDFSHNEVVFRDVYMGVLNLRDCYGCGAPNIKVGHFKVGQGLEVLTSSKYITFMERAMLSVFFPDRSSQIQFWDVFRGGSLGYQASVFVQDTAGFNNVHEEDGDGFFTDGIGYSGRIWWAPIFDCCCSARRLHVGVSASYVTDIGDDIRFRSRPPTHLFQRVVNTDNITDAEDVWVLGAEFAWVHGPWSVQAEYAQVNVTSVSAGDPTFSGWYVFASYWLTGEARKYKEGVFSRVKPCCNWLDKDCCCKGGWEVAARYEAIDLTDANVDGGEATAITLGVNWHWNPNMRVMFNYFFVDVDNPVLAAAAPAFNGDASGFGVRWQVDF